MSKTSPAAYIRQVRQEFSRITWPSRKQSSVSSLVVVVMVAIMGLFFLIVDSLIVWILKQLLG
jgi:preprotein translocase subunit SecE